MSCTSAKISLLYWSSHGVIRTALPIASDEGVSDKYASVRSPTCCVNALLPCRPISWVNFFDYGSQKKSPFCGVGSIARPIVSSIFSTGSPSNFRLALSVTELWLAGCIWVFLLDSVCKLLFSWTFMIRLFIDGTFCRQIDGVAMVSSPDSNLARIFIGSVWYKKQRPWPFWQHYTNAMSVTYSPFAMTDFSGTKL